MTRMVKRVKKKVVDAAGMDGMVVVVVCVCVNWSQQSAGRGIISVYVREEEDQEEGQLRERMSFDLESQLFVKV